MRNRFIHGMKIGFFAGLIVLGSAAFADSSKSLTFRGVVDSMDPDNIIVKVGKNYMSVPRKYFNREDLRPGEKIEFQVSDPNAIHWMRRRTT
jgi:hypothetical protein